MDATSKWHLESEDQIVRCLGCGINFQGLVMWDRHLSQCVKEPKHEAASS